MNGPCEESKLSEKTMRKLKADHYSLLISLKLTHMELERVRREMKKMCSERQFVRSEQERENRRKRQGREFGELTKRRWYDIGVQQCFHGFARVLYDRGMNYAKLETLELCFNWEEVARKKNNSDEMVGKERVASVFEIAQSEMVPRGPIQLGTDMRGYTPLTEKRNDGPLKYVVEMEMRGEKRGSKRSTGRTE